MHGLLERLPDIALELREAAAKSWLKARGVKDEEASALAKEALAVISEPSFAAAFAPGSRAEAPIVGVLPNGRQIAGVIDRLAISADSILAVDFKTDRPAPKDPAKIPPLTWRNWRPTPPRWRAPCPGGACDAPSCGPRRPR